MMDFTNISESKKIIIKSYVIFFTLLISINFTSIADAECPPCGPNYCINTPEYQRGLIKKKIKLQKKYPDHLIKLIEKDGRCIARINKSPELFTIKVVENNKSSYLIEWSKKNEQISNNLLTLGKIKEYYIFNVPHYFRCCGEKIYYERQDYDETLDLNLNLAIKIKNGKQ